VKLATKNPAVYTVIFWAAYARYAAKKTAPNALRAYRLARLVSAPSPTAAPSKFWAAYGRVYAAAAPRVRAGLGIG